MTQWTAAHETPLSMGFLRKEYWSGSPFSAQGDFPNPGIEPVSPASLLHCKWIFNYRNHYDAIHKEKRRSEEKDGEFGFGQV